MLAYCCAPALAQRGDHAGEAQPDIPAEVQIPEAPALSPAEALETFAFAEPGFTIQLAAAEPMIADPVAAVFDEDGRLWVVEMQSYMPNIDGEGELVPTSRILILEDTDADWVFDKATTFMEGLVLPRSVLPCYGGALVIAPPNLLFAKDTDADGKADDIRTLLDGFGGLDNPEHAGNGLLYGLDNWIHISQHNLEIRFDGESIRTRPTPGHGQWGITQDDWGRIYYCPNSDVLRGDLFPKHYAARNPNQRGIRGMNAQIMPDVSVFPSRINPGINRGYQDHMLRDDYTLAVTTSACSPMIYRSGAWGEEFYANAFTCEPAGNCLMRTILDEDAYPPSAHRAYPDTEFLTSTDERFRPVALATGPDGSLFVVDMYRGVIQHKTYVTTFLRKQVEARELELPIHLGRIWRISRSDQGSARRESMPIHTTPPDARAAIASELLPLSRQPNERLVELLGHPDAFFREHAQKILVERRAVEMEDALREIVLSKQFHPVSRAHAIFTLEGLGVVTKDDALAVSWETMSKLSGVGIRLLEPWMGERDVTEIMAGAVPPHGDPMVSLQAAASLASSFPGEWSAETVAGAFVAYADNPLVRSAMITGLHEREALILQHAVAHYASPTPGQTAALAELADTALRGSPAQRTRYLDLIAETLPTDRWFSAILLDRLAAALKLDTDSPTTLELADEPAAWTASLAAGMWDLHPRAAAANDRLRWPGNTIDAEQPRPLAGDERSRYALGRKLFDICAACHGFDGMGLQGQAPPLAGSPIATGPESRTIRVLLQGLQGPIEREGITYDLQMPAAPFPDDEQIASLLTYIRRGFGNTADPVHPRTVARIRAETADRPTPWTEPELLDIP